MKNDGDVSSIEIRRKFLKTSFPMIIHFKIVFFKCRGNSECNGCYVKKIRNWKQIGYLKSITCYEKSAPNVLN